MMSIDLTAEAQEHFNGEKPRLASIRKAFEAAGNTYNQDYEYYCKTVLLGIYLHISQDDWPMNWAIPNEFSGYLKKLSETLPHEAEALRDRLHLVVEEFNQIEYEKCRVDL